MNKTFEYRIYPNNEQLELLQKTFGCCRYVYNRVLAERKDEYEKTHQSSPINFYIIQLPIWKKELEWLKEVDASSLVQTLRNLDRAYQSFFRNPGKVGFPKFKSKYDKRKTYRTQKVAIIDDTHIKLPKLGSIKARISRPIEGHILSVTIKQVPSGKYFVCICCSDVSRPVQPKASIDILGIDAGVHVLATCSNGVCLENPKHLAKSEKRLTREQQRLSRKKKGSANREKQRVKVARIHEKIANQRKDTLHTFTTYAVCESQGIAVEDLCVKGMQKNHHLDKAISDAAMSEMIRQLEYKCAWYGRSFVKIDRFYPSSKMCSKCGHVYDGLTLSEREWNCPQCGTHHDRDLNAARNIAREGSYLLGRVGHTRTAKNASGVGVRPSNRQSTLNGEASTKGVC